jgi:ring-1,2-phenylacetyl-CoA epoxidase subunit PaaC
MKQLGSATDESIARLQGSLAYSLPYACGMFEESPFEKTLSEEGIFPGERILAGRWREKVAQVLAHTRLHLPEWDLVQPAYGGRAGKHSEHLQPLLDEMSEVFRIDPNAEW